MNCRPGDLAIIVRSTVGNEGRVVRVVKWADEQTFTHPETGTKNGESGWFTEGWQFRVIRKTGQKIEATCGVLPDEVLRPLRDNEGTDETLRTHYTKGAM